MGVSMEMPPFTMTSFQSAHGQVAVWWGSETDVRIASELYNSSLQLAVYTDPTLHCGPTQIIEGRCDGGSVHCPRPIKVCLWCLVALTPGPLTFVFSWRA